MTDQGQFKKGSMPNISKAQDSAPGLQSKLDPAPLDDQLPSDDSSLQQYKGAEKLLNKRALITGGDSGIGRATAILFAIEGADVSLVYLPEEEKDAQDVKKEVEKRGRKCLTISANLMEASECKRVVEETVKALGG